MSAEITIDWLMARVVEDEAGCLIWQGHACNSGTAPRARINGKNCYVRRAVWQLVKGTPPPQGHLVGVSCGVDCCLEPSHLVCRTRSAAFKGIPKSMTMRLRVALAKRAVSRISDELVAEIRASELTGEKEGARHGISKDMVNKIRSGALRRDYSNPFIGLGAQR